MCRFLSGRRKHATLISFSPKNELNLTLTFTHMCPLPSSLLDQMPPFLTADSFPPSCILLPDLGFLLKSSNDRQMPPFHCLPTRHSCFTPQTAETTEENLPDLAAWPVVCCPISAALALLHLREIPKFPRMFTSSFTFFLPPSLPQSLCAHLTLAGTWLSFWDTGCLNFLLLIKMSPYFPSSFLLH